MTLHRSAEIIPLYMYVYKQNNYESSSTKHKLSSHLLDDNIYEHKYETRMFLWTRITDSVGKS